MIKYRKDANDVVTLTLDMDKSPTNILNHQICDAFLPVLDQLRQERSKDELEGVIITSAKKHFLIGGDLDYLYQNAQAEIVFEFTENLKAIFRAIETLGVPVVAAMNGSALGSGFELALACHHRVAIENPTIRLGPPEVTLGIMPSGGSVTRLVWLLGLERAFPILTEGERYRPMEAFKLGLIDELATDKKDLLAKAKAWIFQNAHYRRPWDQTTYQIEHFSTKGIAISDWIPQTNARLLAQTKANYPAPHAILGAMMEATLVDFDTANRIESRYFTKLATSSTFRNLTKALWYDTNAIRKNISRPKGFGKFRPKKVGIIGAGRMGSAIAYLCAFYGLEVVLKDVSKSVAEKGRKYCEQLLRNQVQAGKLTTAEMSGIFKKITTTEQFDAFETCDVVIEAVFENLNFKKRVIVETEAHLDEFTLFGTNTSSLSISGLAKAAQRPDGFIGIHFYAPAESEQLVDLICGEQTSDETLARAYDFVRALGKIPIVVRDRRGFYTPRISSMYAMEGIALLLEGVSPVLIEKLAVKAGMPKGPLAMMDEMGLATTLQFEQRKQETFKAAYYHPQELGVLEKMTQELNRSGKRAGGGFYDYPESGEPRLWQGLSEHFPLATGLPDVATIAERLLFVQALDAVRCLEEGTISSVADANLGSIYGWGFPAFKGGVLQYINDYGLSAFVERSKILEKQHGSRFALPKLLLKKAKKEDYF